MIFVYPRNPVDNMILLAPCRSLIAMLLFARVNQSSPSEPDAK